MIRKVQALHNNRGMLDSHKLARLTAEARSSRLPGRTRQQPDPKAARGYCGFTQIAAPSKLAVAPRSIVRFD